jgi:hypothetical protein
MYVNPTRFKTSFSCGHTTICRCFHFEPKLNVIIHLTNAVYAHLTRIYKAVVIVSASVILNVSWGGCDMEAVSTTTLVAVSLSSASSADAGSWPAACWSGRQFHGWTEPLPIAMKIVAVNARTNAASPNTSRHEPGSCAVNTQVTWEEGKCAWTDGDKSVSVLYYYYYYYYHLIELQMDFIRWQWYYNKTQYTNIHISHKISHHTQTKHNTQSYTNNKGHITHNKHNTKK